MMIVLPAIAQELRQKREDVGITQRQLAVLAGCSDTTIGKIEAGCVPRRGTTVERLTRALDSYEAAA